MRNFSSPGRRLVILLSVAAASFCAQVACALTQPIPNGTITIRLHGVGSWNVTSGVGIGEPLALVHANDNTGRLFVATHDGQIRIIQNDSLLSTPYVDFETGAAPLNVVGGFGTDERGLLGLAFHPDFSVTGAAGFGKFYSFTSEPGQVTTTFGHPEIAGGTGNCTNVIREWSTATPAANTFNNSTSRILMTIKKPQDNHNGGAMVFGPDKKLYITVGDGGGGNDFSGGKDNPGDGHTNVTGNAQDLSVVYGKMLRIDPLLPALTDDSAGSISANGQYRIPQSNPFNGPTAGVDEIFLWGLRNPHRFSVDKNNPSRIYIGDVGQGEREEVDFANVPLVTSANNNYGWPYIEGTLDNTNYAQSSAGTIAPIAEYQDDEGVAVIGGFVYRGTAIPALTGRYVFGEYIETGGSIGMLLHMDPATGNIQEMLINTDLGGLAIPSRLLSIGEDASGELYALFFNGQTAKLVIPEPAGLALIALMMPLVRRTRGALHRR